MPYNDVLTQSVSECPYSKFNPYLFDPENTYKHGKTRLLKAGDIPLMILHG